MSGVPMPACTNHRRGGRQRRASGRVGRSCSRLRPCCEDRVRIGDPGVAVAPRVLVGRRLRRHAHSGRGARLPDGIGPAALRADGCCEPRTGIRPVPAELRAHPRRCGHPPVLAVAPYRLRVAAPLPPGHPVSRTAVALTRFKEILSPAPLLPDQEAGSGQKLLETGAHGDGDGRRRDRLSGEWVGKTVASSAVLETGRRMPRNVRAPQGRTVGNTHPEQSARKCNRKQTACRLGEQVRVKRWCKRPPAARVIGPAG